MAHVERWTKGKVELEPIAHVYIHKETQERFTSVTKVLHSIEPPFESDAIAERISKMSDLNPKKNPKYIGMTKEQILENWQYLTDIANEYGTEVHETLERYLLAQKWYKAQTDLEKSVILAYEGLGIDEGVTMYPERIMFSEEHKLAGTSDLIIDHEDDYFTVADFKTNKEFNFISNFNKYYLKPLDYLPVCQYTTYTLQLSIYAYMYQLENPNKKWKESYLLYWDKEALTFRKINTMYMKDQAKKILDLHKHTLLSA